MTADKETLDRIEKNNQRIDLEDKKKLFLADTRKMLLDKKLVDEQHVDEVAQEILNHVVVTKKKLTPQWMKKTLTKYQGGRP